MTESVLAKWLAHLEVQHPKTIDLGLERTREVADRLGLLAPRCKTITVAGTNGKGTCVAALDALLRAQSGVVGLYTSPHLLRYNERIVINGQPAGDDDIVAAFVAIENARREISLSYLSFPLWQPCGCSSGRVWLGRSLRWVWGDDWMLSILLMRTPVLLPALESIILSGWEILVSSSR